MTYRLRSYLFDFIFYTFSSIYLILFFPFMLFLPRTFTRKFFTVWAKNIMFLLKWIVGLDYKIENLEELNNALKKGTCIIACKHQSAWETIIFAVLLQKFVIILKRQLLWIPIFGMYLQKLRSIAIDRTKGLGSIKKMLHQGREAISKGDSILIFPEGTREVPGQKTAYQPGIVALYRDLNVPVIPVAVNSGLYWGRRSLYKRPGVITLKFLPAIEPGLTKNDFIKTLEESIESCCLSL